MSAIAAHRFTVNGAAARGCNPRPRERARPGLGPPVQTQPATGFGPCRLCLRTFREGEAAHPVHTRQQLRRRFRVPPAGAGLHPRRRLRPLRPRRLPAGVPAGTRSRPSRAWLQGRESSRSSARYGEHVEAVIERLLDLPDVDYVNVRNTGGRLLRHPRRPRAHERTRENGATCLRCGGSWSDTTGRRAAGGRSIVRSSRRVAGGGRVTVLSVANVPLDPDVPRNFGNARRHLRTRRFLGPLSSSGRGRAPHRGSQPAERSRVSTPN